MTEGVPPNFPVRTAQFTAQVGGIPCPAITSLYADRIMFVVSHLGTLGTVVHAQKETVLGGGTTYSTVTLLGLRDDPVPELCARQLVERLGAAGCDLPVLLCLGLKRSDPGSSAAQRELVASVVDGLLAHPVWPQAAVAPPPP